MPVDSGDQILASGRHLRLVRRDRWEFVERTGVSGVVGIVAVTPEGNLLLVEQFRPPCKCRVLELPAGLAGDIVGQESEELETAAQRELLEETGYSASKLTRLAVGPSSAGLTNELVALYLAEGLQRQSAGGGDGNEDITVHAIPLQQAAAWLQSRADEGVLIDLKVYAGIYFATQRATP